MSTIQPLSSNARTQPSEGVLKLEQLLKILENRRVQQSPHSPAPSPQCTAAPVVRHQEECATHESMHSQQVKTAPSSDSSEEIDAYFDEEEDEFFDKMCETMLRCVMRQSMIEKEKQKQFKKHIVKVHANWFNEKISRAQFRDSITAFLCGMCPETGNADLDILFRIWDEHDFYTLEQLKNISKNITGTAHTRHSQTVSTAATATGQSTLQLSAPQRRKAVGSVVTEDQLVVGYFCRHSIILLTRIMCGNPEKSEKVALLKDFIKNIWAQWIRKQITRTQLLDSIVIFVCGSCSEAEGVDVVKEFNIWCQEVFKMQQRQKNANTCTSANQPQNVSSPSTP